MTIKPPEYFQYNGSLEQLHRCTDNMLGNIPKHGTPDQPCSQDTVQQIEAWLSNVNAAFDQFKGCHEKLTTVNPRDELKVMKKEKSG